MNVDEYSIIQNLLNKHQADKALKILEFNTNITPEDDELRLLRAKCYLEKKDFQEVKSLSNLVLQEQPDNMDALFLLADSHLGLRNYNKSLDVISRILTINPESVIAYWYQAGIFHIMDLIPESLESLDKAISIDSNGWKLHHRKAVILDNIKKRKEAYQELIKAWHLHPSYETSIALIRSFTVIHPYSFSIPTTLFIVLSIVFTSFYYLIPVLIFIFVFLIDDINNRYWKRVFLLVTVVSLLIAFGFFLNLR
jgi:tetratricopeptide (TPR) repeat protein